MTQWLFDTFVWTSVLIAAVLLLRRPVARYFGPQVAYAMWVLPLLRLVMPTLVLPASFAPVEADPDGAAVLLMVGDAPVAEAGFAFGDLLLPIWLGGAALFLVWRAADYHRMRRELLAHARPVGDAGTVRLVETPDVASPVAFGLVDKVVALPPGFMAQHDLAARDLALAHELAHHRGHDLLANLAAQPLLALHWFNPLAWAGWRAMRSDQEAACDARVIAGREQTERAAYAQVIATFAAGPRLALAAPMACPMASGLLGEKSIIHRLRSLTLTDVSSTRRKIGLAAIATGALVTLPLTASISYAQEEAPSAQEPAQREVRIQVQRQNADDIVAPGEPQIRRRTVIRRDGEEHVIAGDAAEAEYDQLMAQVDEMLANIDIDMEGAADIEGIVERAMEDSREGLQMASQQMPSSQDECHGETAMLRQLADGRQVMVVCRSIATGQAANGLQKAREAIRADDELTLEQKERIIRSLDAEIERMEVEELSLAPEVLEAKPAAPLMQMRVVYTPGGEKGQQGWSMDLVPTAMLRIHEAMVPAFPGE